MTTGEFSGSEPLAYAREMLNRSRAAIRRAVEIVAPETPDANPLEVFPEPGTPRAKDPGLELSTEQEEGLRAAAAELGFGRQTDRTMSELGIRGAHVIIEGGQPHKMVAEAKLVIDDTASDPTTIIFAASAARELDSIGELQSAKRQFGQVGKTEYDNARLAAEHLPGFEPTEDEVMPFGYDINDGFNVGREPTGQFVRIGYVGKIPVVLMRVDRENYVDESGAAKYRNQPNTADVIAIVDTVSKMQGDHILPIAFVTSATYLASRQIDGIRAGLLADRVVGVPAYGTARLAMVKGEAAPTPGPINQLPGELHRAAEQAAALEEIINQYI